MLQTKYMKWFSVTNKRYERTQCYRQNKCCYCKILLLYLL